MDLNLLVIDLLMGSLQTILQRLQPTRGPLPVGWSPAGWLVGGLVIKSEGVTSRHLWQNHHSLIGVYLEVLLLDGL